MSGGGQVMSLLPDNPGVRIEPIQGGGGYIPESKKVSGWHSTPLIIPVASESLNLPLTYQKTKNILNLILNFLISQKVSKISK
jgi:hypothetical protein